LGLERAPSQGDADAVLADYRAAVGSLILNFAIGAALTGFILIEMGEASGKNNL
jgi:hypothetical protein